jgi:hypothetical protein
MVQGARHPARSLFAPWRQPHCEEDTQPSPRAVHREEVKNYPRTGADQLARAAGNGRAAEERAPGPNRGELPKCVVSLGFRLPDSLTNTIQSSPSRRTCSMPSKKPRRPTRHTASLIRAVDGVSTYLRTTKSTGDLTCISAVLVLCASVPLGIEGVEIMDICTIMIV